MQIAKKRLSHIKLVLAEQRLQKQLGESDHMELASVSEASSQWSCERAHHLAFAYSKLA